MGRLGALGSGAKGGEAGRVLGYGMLIVMVVVLNLPYGPGRVYPPSPACEGAGNLYGYCTQALKRVQGSLY